MRDKLRLVLLTLTFCLYSQSVIADGILISWSARDVPGITEQSFNEEYKDQYTSSEKGLEEIKSPEALEALIVSLKPTSEKDKITKDCLKRLYNTDKLPDDPNSPAALCNPDRHTHGYLGMITGIKDKHDYAWWKNWWETNKNQLTWNREKSIFEVKK